MFEMTDLRRAKRTHGKYMAYFASAWNYVDLVGRCRLTLSNPR